MFGGKGVWMAVTAMSEKSKLLRRAAKGRYACCIGTSSRPYGPRIRPCPTSPAAEDELGMFLDLSVHNTASSTKGGLVPYSAREHPISMRAAAPAMDLVRKQVLESSLVNPGVMLECLSSEGRTWPTRVVETPRTLN